LTQISSFLAAVKHPFRLFHPSHSSRHVNSSANTLVSSSVSLNYFVQSKPCLHILRELWPGIMLSQRKSDYYKGILIFKCQWGRKWCPKNHPLKTSYFLLRWYGNYHRIYNFRE
jgi:hypothetical protein